MNKYIILLALLVFPLASASVGYNDIDYGVNYIPPESPINYSLIPTVNNSGYFDGYSVSELYTYYKGMYDLVYATITDLADYLPLAGGTMAGDIDMNDNDITNVGDITATGTGTFGQIIDNGLTASQGVYTDANKQLTSTIPTSGTLGYWNRTGTILSPATSGDDLDMGTGNIKADYYDGGWIPPASVVSEVTVEQVQLYGVVLTMPKLRGTSTVGGTPKALGIANGLYLYADAGQNPSLLFTNAGVTASAQIEYDLLDTDEMQFTSASKYTFDNDVEITGSAKIGDGGTTNYAEIKTDGEINLHGTARVEKCVTIRVGGFKAPGSNPADLVDLGIAQAFAFSPVTQEYIATEIMLPNDMDRTVAPYLRADWSAAATTGTAVWQLEYLYRSEDEDMTASAQETLTGNSDPSTTTNGVVRAELTGIDLPSATDFGLLVRISRLPADADDDMAGDAHLTAIKFCYTSNKLGEAL